MTDHSPWLAEAAMHRILRRTLPAQRHEVLGPLSALKLQLRVAQRRSTDPAQAQAAAANVAELWEAMLGQQLAAQHALTEMRLWDGGTPQQRPWTDVLAQCVGWVRQPAALRGHRLDDPVEDPADAPVVTPADDRKPAGAVAPLASRVGVAVPLAHHLVLACLYATLDPLTAPAHLLPRWRAQPGHTLLWLQTAGRDDLPPGGGLPAPQGGDDALAISTAMLTALAGSSAGAWALVSGPAHGAGDGVALRCATRAMGLA